VSEVDTLGSAGDEQWPKTRRRRLVSLPFGDGTVARWSVLVAGAGDAGFGTVASLAGGSLTDSKRGRAYCGVSRSAGGAGAAAVAPEACGIVAGAGFVASNGVRGARGAFAANHCW